MTGIEYVDESWNFFTGCSPVSTGCKNCWARRMSKRLRGRCGYPTDDPFRVTFHPHRMEQPLHWRRPRRVAVCLMGDLLHPDVPAEQIIDAFGVMSACLARGLRHTFLILTKRPERLVSVLYGSEGGYYLSPGDHYEHILLGTSIENQATALERLPHLDHPLLEPWTKWVSFEPALGDVYWDRWTDLIGWLVLGAESGPGARPMAPHIPQHAREFCTRHGIPYWFKQWGKLVNNPNPDDSTARENGGATKGGHLLDGREWQQFPGGVA